MNTDATPAVVVRPRLPWIAAGIAAAIAAALSIPALRYMRELRAAAPEVRLELNAPPTVDSVSLALSPDGTHIAFIGTSDGRSRLWVRSLNSASARPLERTDGASGPFWSPDSRSIAFFAEGALKRIDIAQGSIQILASKGAGPSGTWGPDGIIFAGSAASGLSKVSSTGRAVTVVTSLGESEQGHRNPQFLPDGRHFAYYVRGSNDVRGIYVSSLDRLPPRRLLDADTAAPVFFAGNKLLFVRQGTLFEQDFDFATLTLQGIPAPLVEQVGVDPQFRAAFSVSADGVVAYRAAAAASRRQFVWFDRAGKELARVGDPDENRAFSPQLSPDDSHVAMHRSVTGNVDVWLLDLRRQVLTRFTSDPANELTPIWSPDGSQIVFGRFRAGIFELRLSTLDGQDHPLGINGLADDWSSDGRFLLVSDRGNLRALSLDTKQLSVVTEQGGRGQFSPDAKWVAYESAESGQFEVYVQSFPKAGPKLRISTSGGAQPRWRRDGRELFYVAFDERLMAVPVHTLNGTLELLPPVPLFKTTIGGAVQELTSASYMVTTDGQRFFEHPAGGRQHEPHQLHQETTRPLLVPHSSTGASPCVDASLESTGSRN